MERTVLLVDDERHLVDSLQRTLRAEPYTIVGAASAQAALEVLATRPVDVIVADEHMPGMSGTELLAIVRRKYPSIMRLMLTGQASVESMLRAINEGQVYRFLTKPCSQADLAGSIRNAIEHKALVDETEQLLRTVKRQTALIAQIERANPGITELHKTPDGAIVIDDDLPHDFDQFMREINARVEQAEKILNR
jgi:two-component system probable response regulator PhcQ